MSATFQQIQMNYWRDTTDDEFTQAEKMLYLYLMTNESVTSCGMYKISRSTMARETSMTDNAIKSAMASLQDRGKIFYDETTKELFLVNHIHYESTSPTFQANVEKVKKRIHSQKILEMRALAEEGSAVDVPEVPKEAPVEKKEKEDPRKDKKPYGEYKNVFLSEKEVDTLIVRFRKAGAQEAVNILGAYKEAHNKTYASDYAAINSWVVEELDKKGYKDKAHSPDKALESTQKMSCPVCGHVPTGDTTSGECNKCGFSRSLYSDPEAAAKYQQEMIDGGLAERIGLSK